MSATTARAAAVAMVALLVAIVLLGGPFESIGAADVERIRHARWLLETSCRTEVTAQQMADAALVLEDHLERAPERPLPLAGGGMWSMTRVVREVTRFLSKPIAPGRTLGGEPAAADLPCRAYGPAIAARLRGALAAAHAGRDAAAWTDP